MTLPVIGARVRMKCVGGHTVKAEVVGVRYEHPGRFGHAVQLNVDGHARLIGRPTHGLFAEAFAAAVLETLP